MDRSKWFENSLIHINAKPPVLCIFAPPQKRLAQLSWAQRDASNAKKFMPENHRARKQESNLLRQRSPS